MELNNPKAKMKYEQVAEVRCVLPNCNHKVHRNDPLSLRRLVSKKSHREPRWAKRILNEHGCDALMKHGSWRDHIGYCGEYLISEPYGLVSEYVRDLVEFCDKYGLDFEIDACSQHYPTQTLVVFVWPKEEADNQQQGESGLRWKGTHLIEDEP